MSIATSVKWQGDGRTAVWRIPFPFGGETDVGVALIDEDGIQRNLTAGQDYVLQGDNVICVAPSGKSLYIWLKTSLETAVSANARKALGPGYVAEVQTQVAAQEANEAARAESVLARAREDCQAVVAQARQSLAASAEESAAELEALAKKLQDYVANTLRDCAQLREIVRREALRGIAAASQASLYRNMPGIASVDSVMKIQGPCQGLFIVNPYVKPAPSPFMGIWPAENEAQMTWDGIFFIGPPYPDDVKLPPAMVLPPEPGEKGRGNAGDWLPCEHGHTLTINCGCKRGEKE